MHNFIQLHRIAEMLQFYRATLKWCLQQVPIQDTRTHFLNVQIGELTLSTRFNSSNLILWAAALQPLCSFPQEFTYTKGALNDLIRPRRLSQWCWMTGTPPGTLPTQTYSCSPTPAASSALCKPLLCLQSVRWVENMLLKTTTAPPTEC